MPYLNDEMKERRHDIVDRELHEEITSLINSIRHKYTWDEYPGVCNYVISRVVAGVMKPSKGWRYHALNSAYGTFMSAAAEFYRRLVVPYEDKCIHDNGDIPEYETEQRVVDDT